MIDTKLLEPTSDDNNSSLDAINEQLLKECHLYVELPPEEDDNASDITSCDSQSIESFLSQVLSLDSFTRKAVVGEMDVFGDGSKSSAVVNLCSATLGAGVLSLPYAFSKSGLVLGIGLLVLASFATSMSIEFLVFAVHSKGISSTYESLTQHFFGRYARYLVEFCILLFCWGCAIAYIVAVGDILATVLPQTSKEFCMVLFWSVIMFPLSLLERINSLRYASFIGVASIFVLIGSVVFHSVVDYRNPTIPHQPLKIWPESLMDVIRAIPIVMFAFSCQINVPIIYSELKNSSPAEFRTVTKCAVVLCLLAFLLVSIFAYLDFGDLTQKDILQNYCILDEVMLTAFLCITMGVTMAFPLNIFPSRITLHEILLRICSCGARKEDVSIDSQNLRELLLDHSMSDNDDEHTEMNSTRCFVLTLTLAGSALIAALLVPDISIVFGLLGGTTSSTICYIMPALFYRKARSASSSCQGMMRNVFSWVLLLGGLLIGVVTTGVTIYSMIVEQKQENPCSQQPVDSN